MGACEAGCGALTDPDWSRHCGDRWRAHVLETTGRDICDLLGASPRRPRDWVAMMRRAGARDMAGVMRAVHGDPIPYRRAMRGDLVTMGWAIGICRGELAEFFGGVTMPMNRVDAAWSLARG